MRRTLRPAVDAWVDNNFPGKNHRGGQKIRLRGTGSGGAKRGFIFVGRPFPVGAYVLDARLKLRVADAWAGSHDVVVRRVTEAWREGTINWNNQPAVATDHQVVKSVGPADPGDEISFNVTDIFSDIAGNAAWFGLRLHLDSDVARTFWSSDAPNARMRPILEVEFTMKPEAPENLVPTGGRAAGTDKPTLRWDFGDRWGDDADQSESRVQIATTEFGFGSPEYDSGKVANVQQNWDLSTTAYAGVPEGESRWWRVKAWDEQGKESDWSDAVEFTYAPKTTLTITNPAGPDPRTVPETTPPIAWDLGAGATQRSREIWLYALNVPTGGIGPDGTTTRRQLLHHEPNRRTTEEQWTIPRGLIKSGNEYRLVLRVWDDVDRVGTAGYPRYVEATVDFTYARDGTPDPVTNFVVSSPAGDAGVLLTWDRASRPDWFSLRVDGVEVEDRLDPEDLSTGGTSYAYIYWGAKPYEEHTFEIEAVVDTGGRLYHSSGNPTGTAEPAPTGIWLIDPADDTFVRIGGPSDLDMEIKEIAETFDIPGRRRPVRVTESLGGYAGSVSGFLAHEDVDTFLELKGRLKSLWLVGGRLSIPVFLEEITDLTPDGEIPKAPRHSVGFNCFQAGRFDRTFEVAG